VSQFIAVDIDQRLVGTNKYLIKYNIIGLYYTDRITIYMYRILYSNTHTLLSTRAPLKFVPSELGLAGKLTGRLGIDSNRNRFEVVGVVTVICGDAGPGSLILLFRLSLSPARDLPPTPPS